MFNGRTGGRTNGRMDGWIDGWMLLFILTNMDFTIYLDKYDKFFLLIGPLLFPVQWNSAYEDQLQLRS